MTGDAGRVLFHLNLTRPSRSSHASLALASRLPSASLKNSKIKSVGQVKLSFGLKTLNREVHRNKLILFCSYNFPQSACYIVNRDSFSKILS